ncbi:MAG: multidrug efflux RND transporter permease subunit [Planctomycetaceae bacterium]|nr:multidrug efflux RND transporter permease subunit [Planctomycetaceae bacterium]
MSSFFIRRPIFATVIALIMLLAGIATMFTLPIAQFPNIVPPTVQVSAVYNGADAETVANAVTSPLEQQINGVQGMLYMSSNSTNTGQSIITCTFEVGYDLNIAAVDVQNRAQQAFSQLPQEVQQLGVTVTKQASNMTIVAALRSPDGSYDSRYLTNLADIAVSPALARLPGVGTVTVFGLEQYSMRVWLDPAKLASMGMTSADVVRAVQAQNKQAAIGSIGAEPSEGRPSFVLSLTTDGRLQTVEEFEDIVVRTGADGAVVRVRDVGRAEMGSYLYSSTSHYNGNGAALIGVYQLPDANAFDVAQSVREEIERLSPMFPPGVTHEVAYDTTLFVQASLDELVKTLVEAAILVLIVIFIFLQDWRATLIPMIAIPVSIVGTFAVMAAFGFSINSLTLLGLVLAIGLVVDDAIIVVENVYHQVENGVTDMRQAAVNAMAQVTGPIVATSLVLLAVFIPAALMPGITGQLYNQFALTIAFSIALSCINSLTLSPALAAIFLKPGKTETKFVPFVLFNRFFDGLREEYGRVIHWFGEHWYIVAAVFLMAVGTIGYMLARTPTAFIPNEDQGYYFVGVQLPPGSSLRRTVEVSETARRLVAEDPAVVNVLQIEGFNLFTSTGQTNAAFLIAVLKPWEERDPRTENARAIIERALPKLRAVPEAIVFPVPPPPIAGLGNAGGFQLQLEDSQGVGFDEFSKVAREFMDAARKRPELTGINSPFTDSVPVVRVEIDRTKVQALGVSLSDVYTSLGQNLGQSFVNNFNMFGQVYNVMVQAEALQRMGVQDIMNIHVRNAQGGMVPMSAIAKLSLGVATDNATHYNLFNTIQVNGSPAKGFSSGDAIKAIDEVAKATLPAGFTYEWTGTTYQEIESGGYAGIIFGLSLVAVFLLLAAQYESWVLPFNVLLAVAFAVLGALIALHLTGIALNTYAQIGLVMLVGLAAKNAIMITEFAAERYYSGESVRDAAVNASKLRLRPILMTSFAFILGILPLVVATGAGAMSRRSIGTVVLGGMLGAVVVDQIVVPTLFVMLMGAREKLFGRPKPPGAHPAAEPAAHGSH